MHFEGSFTIPGKAQDVVRRFADVPRMSRCMPGAILEPQAEDGSWPGAMVVAFGPKKVNFKGRVTTAFDFEGLSGTLHGRGSADMRAARIGVKVSFMLRDDPAASVPTTVVNIVSDAELGGVLADFARTGGVAVANLVMADFARRATEEFAQDEAPMAKAAASPPSPCSAAVPLAAHALLWAVVKAQFMRLGKWLRLVH
jgi:carbon monoxide dehydrogenase subunit G